MYAVIETGGKQVRVSEGSVIYVEKLDVEAGGTTAIEYALSGDDYDTIATDLATSYPGPAANLLQFGSFDVRSSSDNYWSEAMILEGLNIILPTATEGDVYAVSYEIYNGSRGTETMTLLYTAGAYIANATLVEVTAVVAKKLGRKYSGIEKDKKYFSAARKRIEEVKEIEDKLKDAGCE